MSIYEQAMRSLAREKRALPWIGPKTIDYRPHSEAQQANSGGENTG